MGGFLKEGRPSQVSADNEIVHKRRQFQHVEELYRRESAEQVRVDKQLARSITDMREKLQLEEGLYNQASAAEQARVGQQHASALIKKRRELQREELYAQESALLVRL